MYLHKSRTPGPAQFIARMRPVAVVRSQDVFDKLPDDERESNWLASTVSRRRGRKRRKIPVWRAFPYLIVGSGAWDVDVEGIRGLRAKYGKLGAAGMVFHVLVAGLR